MCAGGQTSRASTIALHADLLRKALNLPDGTRFIPIDPEVFEDRSVLVAYPVKITLHDNRDGHPDLAELQITTLDPLPGRSE